MADLSKDLVNKIGALHQKADADPAFAHAFESDPKGTLAANGISAEGLTFADHSGGDVSGYMRNELPDNCICLWHDQWGNCTVSFCL